jgi:hypothetical protein
MLARKRDNKLKTNNKIKCKKYVSLHFIRHTKKRKKTEKLNNKMNEKENEDKQDKEFDSMLQLTNFILFNNETDGDLTFDLSARDLNQINYFVNELDAIYDDLVELNQAIRAYRNNYRLYCENLLRICDEKDLLVEMFLNYYDEYILIEDHNDSEDEHEEQGKKKKKRKKKTLTLSYAVPVQNRYDTLHLFSSISQ